VAAAPAGRKPSIRFPEARLITGIEQVSGTKQKPEARAQG
jgi:hypothetical protein